MNIRHVKPEDNKTLATVIRKVFEEHNAPTVGTVYSDTTTDQLFELFQHPKAVLWVAEETESIVGCCGIYPTEGLPDSCTELVKFYIAKEARGKGIGRQLMEASIASAKLFGYSEMYIESLPVFLRAVSIYEKQGFVKLHAPMGNSGHPGCNIWMKKVL